MPISPNPAAPGQQLSVSATFQHSKDGFLALLPGSVGAIFATDISDWKGYMTAHGMLAFVDFSGATSVSATFNAPQQPGDYQVQVIVPADGGRGSQANRGDCCRL